MSFKKITGDGQRMYPLPGNGLPWIVSWFSSYSRCCWVETASLR